MVDLPLGRADYNRAVAKEARIQTRNVYFETNPILTDTGVAMIARPALRRFVYVGSGPIRAVYSQSGVFEEALFVVSGTEWYRVDLDGTATLLQSGLNPKGTPSMAATAPIGTTPAYCFLADGIELYCYIENGYAKATVSGAPANGSTINTGGTTYYQFTTGSVDAGTPAGTSAAPWLIAIGATEQDTWTNFANSLNNKGVPGTDYSTAIVENPDIAPQSTTANSVTVRAQTAGAGEDGITLAASAPLAWTSATLVGGGAPNVLQVVVPGNVGAVSVAFIASYIVVIPAQGGTINGRFYWVEPGETTIDPLDFATAERAPDAVYNVVVFGDQFWLPGATTTEVWYFTGNINAPVQRLQGVTFDRGTWPGTALQVKESMIIVDSDGGVFQIAGGLTRISNPSVEERIRGAILNQAAKGY